jgi:hypothetical protein
MSTSRSCSAHQIAIGETSCLLPTGLKQFSNTEYLRLSESPFGEEANLHTPRKGNTGQQQQQDNQCWQPHLLLVLVYGSKQSGWFFFGCSQAQSAVES